MFERLSGVFCAVLLAGTALAEVPQGPRPLSGALSAAARGDWVIADVLAEKAGPEALELMDWMRLSRGKAPPAEVLAFMRDHANWPGLKLMARRSEARFAEALAEERLELFGRFAPQTGLGVLAYAEALDEAGKRAEAEAVVAEAWRSFDLNAELHEMFLERWGKALAEHHDTRMDMVLWRGLRDDFTRMTPLLGEGQQALAEARFALRNRAGKAEALVAAVPEALRGDAGLAYELFLDAYKRGPKEEALRIIRERSQAGALGEPKRWAGWRRSLVRQLMREGDPKGAYALALNHGLSEGSAYADLEWLAGYLALRKLDKPEAALAHFQKFEAAVATPISLGRAGFWEGEALSALGRKAEAQAAYEKGAQHQTSFYGLLAAERAGVPLDPALRGVEYFPAWQGAAFADDPRVGIIMLAVKNGRLSLAEQFLLSLAEGADRTTLGQLGNMAEDFGAPHLQVMLGKRAAQRGIVLPQHYYALHPLAETKRPVPSEMALAIARRESEFDPRVRSGAGAEGLMQLMPATAAEVAAGLGLEHERARVLRDWAYNAELGSAYLAGLAERFGGNVVMVSAAYNAGPSRPERWMVAEGDPRVGDMDVIDWIEHIPFNETRNYVMRVAESLPVYRARLGREALPEPFSKELIGRSLLP